MRFTLILLTIVLVCPSVAFRQSNLNQDWEVNTSDLIPFAEDWLVPGYWSDNQFITSDADFNYDGIVNQADLGLLSREWLAPEPNAPEGYSNQPVTVWAGGYGYAEAYGEPALFPGRTYGFASDRFLAGGTLRSIRVRLYTDNGTDPILGTAKLKILSGSASPFTLQADLDITDAVNLAKQTVDEYGRFTLTLDCLPYQIAVNKSDFIAFYFPEHICFVRAVEAPVSQNGQVVYNAGGDAEGPTVSLDREMNGAPYAMDFRLDSPEFIIYDNPDPIAAPSGIELPYFETESQYIILEGVSLSFPENLVIDLCQTSEDGSEEVLKTITLVNLLGSHSIDFDGSASTISCDYTGRYNIHIWTDPLRGRMDVLYYNNYLFNIRHVSLTNRQPRRIQPGVCIRRLRIHQDYGTHGRVNRVVVCRKPILAVGDSFVSLYEDGTVLGYVGKAMAGNGVFSENRYVINGGIGGNMVLVSTPATTSIQTRWNDLHHDLCAYRDVIAVFVNGPGLNDISQLTAADTAEQVTQKAQDLAEAITGMAGEALSDGDPVGGRNAAVLCEMIPFTKYRDTDFQRYLNHKSCQEQVNLLLADYASQHDIPMAMVYDEIPESYSDGAHPTTQGSLWIAQQIAHSYEDP